MRSTRLTVKLHRSARRIKCYASGMTDYILPRMLLRVRLPLSLKRFSDEQRREITSRADYYNRLSDNTLLPEDKSITIGEWKFPYHAKQRFATYFFDLFKVLCRFPKRLRFAYVFGDVDAEPPVPAFVKSRPIPAPEEHVNGVILKLNAARHYLFVADRIPFREKKDMLVSRNVVRQPQRKRFIDLWQDDPLCDIGQSNTDVDPSHEHRIRPYMSIPDQQQYKFIACIEGHDVATNLKWVMASNSVAVMPRPKFETWFMEGTLIPGVHYIEIRPDYSDLREKLLYYIAHPEEAEAIIENAHAYVRRFLNPRVERATALLTAQKYFQKTSQL